MLRVVGKGNRFLLYFCVGRYSGPQLDLRVKPGQTTLEKIKIFFMWYNTFSWMGWGRIDNLYPWVHWLPTPEILMWADFQLLGMVSIYWSLNTTTLLYWLWNSHYPEFPKCALLPIPPSSVLLDPPSNPASRRFMPGTEEGSKPTLALRASGIHLMNTAEPVVSNMCPSQYLGLSPSQLT